ncbi:type II toxin-antitoxin system VapC family toxin [Xenorhabdus thailandensis]|uniref:type II toxin-antitoxin system VapC family toxin n=1 Tax=Xenorhabdus thailandensis TaxID=3136255 RepID=UPI0030F46246
MEFLLDTNILLFMAYEPEKLKADIADLLEDTSKTLCFSAASIWEVVIKSDHTLVVCDLPEQLNKDPFDRLIVAQAKHNKIPLITSDSKLIDFVSDYITVIPNR